MSPEEILKVIEGIGTMLEPSAQAAWDIAMRQVRVEAVLFLWAAILSGVIALLCVASLLHYYFAPKRDWNDEPIGQWFGLAFGLLASFFCAAAYYGRTANPAYYVISWLLKMVP